MKKLFLSTLNTLQQILVDQAQSIGKIALLAVSQAFFIYSSSDLNSFQPFTMADECEQFITNHPNMTCRNTQDILNLNTSLTGQSPITGPQTGGATTIGVYFNNCPLNDGSTIRLILSSEKNPSIAYDTGVQLISTNEFGFTLDWPSNDPDDVVLTYIYQTNSENLPPGLQIKAFTSWLPPSQQGNRFKTSTSE